MGNTIQEGPNHTIVAHGEVVVCTVWSVPDMPAQEGARQAESMMHCLNSQVLLSSSPYRGMILNLVQGPPVFGPRTRDAIEGMIDAARVSEMRMAFVVGDSAIQQLQFRSLCSERTHVTSTRSEQDAEDFVRNERKAG